MYTSMPYSIILSALFWAFWSLASSLACADQQTISPNVSFDRIRDLSISTEDVSERYCLIFESVKTFWLQLATFLHMFMLDI